MIGEFGSTGRTVAERAEDARPRELVGDTRDKTLARLAGGNRDGGALVVLDARFIRTSNFPEWACPSLSWRDQPGPKVC